MQIVYHTDDDFRVTKRRPDSRITWIEHRCANSHLRGDRGDTWDLMWCDTKSHERCCNDCGRSATPGLQAVFLFMKEA